MKNCHFSRTDPFKFACTTNNGAITITKYTGNGGAVTIPDTTNGYPVTSIGNDAFDECNGLISVTIPNTVTSIGYGVFGFCASLTSVYFAGNAPERGRECVLR